MDAKRVYSDDFPSTLPRFSSAGFRKAISARPPQPYGGRKQKNKQLLQSSCALFSISYLLSFLCSLVGVTCKSAKM